MRFTILPAILLAIFASAMWVSGQSMEDEALFGRKRDRQEVKNIREMLYKLQIEHAQKEHDELLDRGDQIVDITAQLEKSVEQSGTLSADDRRRLENLEKLAKKVRGELGGDDDDGTESEDLTVSTALVDGVKVLRTSSVTLHDELKKSTRFSISAIAIQSSNTVLRAVRFLRGISPLNKH